MSSKHLRLSTCKIHLIILPPPPKPKSMQSATFFNQLNGLTKLETMGSFLTPTSTFRSERAFTSGLLSSSRLPLPCLRPIVFLQIPFSSHASPSCASLPVFFLKPSLITSCSFLKPLNGSLSVQFSSPGIRVLHNLTTSHTPVNVALYTFNLCCAYTGFPLVPECLRPFHHFILFTLPGISSSTSSTGKLILIFQDFAEMSPFS